MATTTKTLFGIWCATGCSCCRDDNAWWNKGFDTAQQAEDQILEWLTGGFYPVSSQYAERGCYEIYRFDLEVLSDGRWVCGNFIAAPEDFWEKITEDSRYHSTFMGLSYSLEWLLEVAPNTRMP